MTETPSSFAGRLALGHFLRFYSRDKFGEYVTITYAFQNFYFGVNKQIDNIEYMFLPFGFSGVTTNTSGDVEPASLVFPNDEQGLSRSFITEALRGEDSDIENPEQIIAPYVAEIDVLILDTDSSTQDKHTKLYTYTGQAYSASWDDTEAMLELAYPLDAVVANLPVRTLRKDLVGNLPTSSRIRIR